MLSNIKNAKTVIKQPTEPTEKYLKKAYENRRLMSRQESFAMYGHILAGGLISVEEMSEIKFRDWML